MAEFSDVVRRRRMVRSFTDEPVAPDIVRRIVDTARRGPSAGYSQGVEFVVITDRATREALAAPAQETFDISGHHNFVAQAPVHVVVCVSPAVYRSRYREADKMTVVAGIDDEDLWAVPYWYQDAGSALMLLLLAAVDEGIGAAFVGGEADLLHRLLGIPDEYIPVGTALLGHEAPDARSFGDVAANPRRRRAFDAVVHFERW
jgi:nitroreductase